MPTIDIVDSHTAGEPTRVIVGGGPDLGTGPLADRRQRFQAQFDHYRTAVVHEPRGSEVLVGALLCEPADQTCACGVIFFNNVGYLGMCGHGMIGVVATLRHLGRLQPGIVRLETSVGVVVATLHEDDRVSIENVPSYRHQADVTVELPGTGRFTGDVAWGGNWFYLVAADIALPLTLANVDVLTDLSWRLRHAVNAAGFPEVDHVELFGNPSDPQCDSRNFVLCPGQAYDRSPCGTGTSAKLACLAAAGELAPGETWVQESILGTRFEGRYVWHDVAQKSITPTIAGRAYVNAEARLFVDEADPFAWGIRR
ncbi:MAG: hydroxyproline-2-epimerase [Planctomycetales bacterium 12-60-4]|nr:MAG: hydroxyproline-2-epimerase [Planctomycetales bacterium 12-60-4]